MSNVTDAWLQSNTVRRCVLITAGYYDVGSTTEKTVYLSNMGYSTTSGDVNYLPIVAAGLQFSESMSIDGGISSSIGDIELHNPNGTFDSWIDATQRIWVNRSIQIYYGDPSWTSATISDVPTSFELVFDGLIFDIDSRSRETLNIKVRDKMERLNAPLTETKLGTYGTWGGGQTNQDATRPLVFGEVHNMTPLQTDPSQIEFMFNSGTTESLIEVRDNGVPIYNTGLTGGANVTLTAGTFRLTAALAGVATCSVQGVKRSIDLTNGNENATYVNNIANLVALITTKFGKSYTQLAASDLDLTNLAAFQTANSTKAVGIVINDSATVLDACQQLCSSLGAQIYFTRKGKLQLLQLGIPTSDASITITDNDIIHHSLNITGKTNVVATATLGYCKNWTVQEGLVTGIPQQHKDMFATEWFTYTPTIGGAYATTKTVYKLTADPVQKNTMLIQTADATTEANRLQAYYYTPHIIYSFIGTPRMQQLKLGQPVTLIHSRFGLYNGGAGRSGQVVALGPNWSTGQVNVGVLI
jgi:hypothetical protein